MMVTAGQLEDLARLEDLLAGIQDDGFRDKFGRLIQETYMDIYDNHLTEEQKTIVDKSLRDAELQDQGWRFTYEIYEKDGWSARIYQHSWWGHWRVEMWDLAGRLYQYDEQFETEEEMEKYSNRWVSSSSRPWG